MSVLQTALVLVLVATAVLVGARSLSTSASDEMEVTAEGIADPSKLTKRF